MCKTSLQTLGGVRQDKKGKSIDTGSETGFQRQICRHGVGWDRIPKTRIQTWGGVRQEDQTDAWGIKPISHTRPLVLPPDQII